METQPTQDIKANQKILNMTTNPPNKETIDHQNIKKTRENSHEGKKDTRMSQEN